LFGFAARFKGVWQSKQPTKGTISQVFVNFPEVLS